MPQFPHLCDMDSDAAALSSRERNWSFIPCPSEKLGNSVTVEEGAKKKKAGLNVLEGNKPVGEREGFLSYHLLKHDSCWAGIQLFPKDHR